MFMKQVLDVLKKHSDEINNKYGITTSVIPWYGNSFAIATDKGNRLLIARLGWTGFPVALCLTEDNTPMCKDAKALDGAITRFLSQKYVVDLLKESQSCTASQGMDSSS
jgi:hypothetical protein